MQSVLVASGDRAETHALCELLGRNFAPIAIASPAQLETQPIAFDAALVDANFTVHRGIDFMMEISLRRRVPVVLVTPESDPRCALEAMRAGAFNFIVKSQGWTGLASQAISDALRWAREVPDKRRVLGRERRIGQISHALAGVRQGSPRGSGHAALREAVERLRDDEINLPPYPEINLRLRRLVASGAPLERIGELLRADAAVTARLLALANSAWFGGAGRIGRLEQALTRVGLEETRLAVELICNRALYVTRNAAFAAPLRELWMHSLACACGARIVASRAGLASPGEVFVMGLLHDIGALFLLRSMAEMNAADVGAGLPDMGEVLLLVRRHHAEVGEIVVRRWNLPEACARAALRHAEADPDAPRELLAVQFANLLANRMGYSLGPVEPFDLAATQSAQRLGLGADDIAPLGAELQRRVEDCAAVLA